MHSAPRIDKNVEMIEHPAGGRPDGGDGERVEEAEFFRGTELAGADTEAQWVTVPGTGPVRLPAPRDRRAVRPARRVPRSEAGRFGVFEREPPPPTAPMREYALPREEPPSSELGPMGSETTPVGGVLHADPWSALAPSVPTGELDHGGSGLSQPSPPVDAVLDAAPPVSSSPPPMPSAEFARRPRSSPPPMPPLERALDRGVSGAPPPPTTWMGLAAPGPPADAAAPFTLDREAATGAPSLFAPLVAIATSVAAVVAASFANAMSSDRGFDGLRSVAFYLEGFGPWSGLLVVAAAGLITIRRPVTDRAAVGTTVLGAMVVFGGFLAFATTLLSHDDGLADLFRVVVRVVTGAPGAAMLLGGVAAVAAHQASQEGDQAPVLPVIGLLAGAALQGLSGAMSVLVGLFDFLPFEDKLTLSLASFDVRAAALVLGAAILLTLYGRRSDLTSVVALGAGAVMAVSFVSTLLVALVGLEAMATGTAAVLLAPTTLALASVAGVLALLADGR